MAKDIIQYIIVFVVMTLGAITLDYFTNNTLQDKCINAGGIYYKSINPTKSLCKLPENTK